MSNSYDQSKQNNIPMVSTGWQETDGSQTPLPQAGGSQTPLPQAGGSQTPLPQAGGSQTPLPPTGYTAPGSSSGSRVAKKSPILQIVLGVLLVIVIIGVAGFFAYKHFFQNDPQQTDGELGANMGNGVQLAWQFEIADADIKYNHLVALENDKFAFVTKRDGELFYNIFSPEGSEAKDNVGAGFLLSCEAGTYSLQEGKFVCEEGESFDLDINDAPSPTPKANGTAVIASTQDHNLMTLHQPASEDDAQAGGFWMVAMDSTKRVADVEKVLEDATWVVELVNPSSIAPGKTGALISTPLDDKSFLLQFFSYASTPQSKIEIPAADGIKPLESRTSKNDVSEESQATTIDGPLTKTHCTRHSGMCFNYPDNAHIEENNTDMIDKYLPASDDPNLMESGKVIGADGTPLVWYTDNWLGQRLFEGETKVVKVWPTEYDAGTGSPAVISANISRDANTSSFSPEIHVTSEPQLSKPGSYMPYTDPVPFIFGSLDGATSSRFLKIPGWEKAGTEAEAIAMLESERYQRALNILKTVHNK